MIDSQAIAGCVALDPVAAEGLPEVRDVGLDDVPSLLWRLFTPDLVDQGVGRHELVRADDETRQDHALLGAAERDGADSGVHLERPEDVESQSSLGTRDAPAP